MIDKTCCFTGHRDVVEEERCVRARVIKEIVKLIETGVENFIVGGARGFDTIVAEQIFELKKQYSHIKLIMALPCENQTRGWSIEDKARYNILRHKADKVKVLSEYYYQGCMLKRNRYMVDSAKYCICYLRKNSGGTAYTVNYAKKKGLQIIYV